MRQRRSSCRAKAALRRNVHESAIVHGKSEDGSNTACAANRSGADETAASTYDDTVGSSCFSVGSLSGGLISVRASTSSTTIPIAPATFTTPQNFSCTTIEESGVTGTG